MIQYLNYTGKLYISHNELSSRYKPYFLIKAHTRDVTKAYAESCPTVARKYDTKAVWNQVMFLQDSSSCQKTLVSLEKLNQTQLGLLVRPRYSSELSPIE